ncbi:MAG: hypothetical protein DRN81_01285 [Thermoproteota archaeon]|nr:MAG: hypothetical protein DRN81_01285 [Candidatus Korarchaeota archaeon]
MKRKYEDEFETYLKGNFKEYSAMWASDEEYAKFLEKILTERGENKPRLFIYVEGGVIQTISSTVPTELLVLDGDVDGIDDFHNYEDIDGDSFQARVAWSRLADFNERITNHYFDQQFIADEKIIYTLGKTSEYEMYFEQKERVVKMGRSVNYLGGSVWETFEEAQRARMGNKDFSVYGVLADWDHGTAASEEGSMRHLLRDSTVIKLDQKTGEIYDARADN